MLNILADLIKIYFNIIRILTLKIYKIDCMTSNS